MTTEEPFRDLDLDPDAFRRLGHRAVDMMADYYAGIRDVPVFPPRPAKDIAAVFDAPLPETGRDPDAILDDWREKVLPNATHLGSPRYFGFVNGSGTMMGALADALAASVNMNVGAWKPGPAATEIERRCIAWIAELIGYPAGAGGLFVSGGQMANVTALLAALRHVADYDTAADGLQSPKRRGPFRLYLADHEGHSSIVRAVDLLNLGRNAIRRVPSRDDFTMDPEALEALIERDAADGNVPFCVVGQAGSINVGAVDPLDEIADVCERRGLWFHADGACGAVGAMLPELRGRFRGLERADSVTLDPHKWLYINYECGCVLVRDPEALRRAFSMSASYLRGTLPTEHTGHDFFEHGPQMSRGFRALKVWMTMQHWGAEGYRTLLRQNLHCVRHLDALVRAAPDFEALHEPVINIYSFRYRPQDLGADADARSLDRLNQRIADAIQVSGVAFLMTTSIRGRTALRLSICSHRTTLGDIDTVFAKLRELGRALHDRPASSG